ncbi:MAG: universal stress protein [Planctomycetota bacterium]|nr:MAG: universal stress protein [Planctomycetota bacterium]
MIRIKKILYPTDFSDLAKHALVYVRSFAEAYSAEVHVIHIVDESYQYWMAMGPNSLPIGPAPEELANTSKTELEKLVNGELASMKFPVQTAVVVGRPYLEIVKYAKDKAIDLIIIGTHGRSGIAQALLGSVAEKVVRKAPCPVLTVRSPEHDFVLP